MIKDVGNLLMGQFATCVEGNSGARYLLELRGAAEGSCCRDLAELRQEPRPSGLQGHHAPLVRG